MLCAQVCLKIVSPVDKTDQMLLNADRILLTTLFPISISLFRDMKQLLENEVSQSLVAKSKGMSLSKNKLEFLKLVADNL